MDHVLLLEADFNELHEALALLERVPEVVEALTERPDPKTLVLIESERRPARGAFETIIRAKPSERLVALVAAARAREAVSLTGELLTGE